VNDDGPTGGNPGLLDEIAQRWAKYFQPDDGALESWEHASFVAVEPDEAGTWCVRVHAAGEADLVAGGLNRAQASETMMGLMELLSRRYSDRPGRPWRN
jgi:hypothetical protein